jgi:hypothetical protein
LQDMLRDESLGIDDLSRARLADNLLRLSARRPRRRFRRSAIHRSC